MKLEEKLVSLRKAKGLSQMKLAEKMNVSRQAISRWETGAAIPSSENLKYLSDLYSVSLDYLLSDEKTKEYVFDLFWSEHTSVDEQSVINFCSQKGVNYSDLSNNDRELATDAYTNFLQQDYFLEFQESLVDSAEIIY